MLDGAGLQPHQVEMMRFDPRLTALLDPRVPLALALASDTAVHRDVSPYGCHYLPAFPVSSTTTSVQICFSTSDCSSTSLHLALEGGMIMDGYCPWHNGAPSCMQYQFEGRAIQVLAHKPMEVLTLLIHWDFYTLATHHPLGLLL